MAKISYSRAFDISRQFYFGDWTGASISATATALTMNLGGARIVLGGSFTVAGTLPTAGTITSLTYSTVGATPVTEFSVTGISMSYGSFMDAMADGDFNAVAGNGADSVSGSTGGDKLYGGAGNDRLEGLAGNDALFGGAGNDTLDGGAGNDSMQGGTGNDNYIIDSSQDRVVELANGGIDTVRTSLSAYVLGAEIENIWITGNSNATGAGNSLNNIMIGGRGNDSLSGLDGNDTLRGGNGHDTLIGGNGNDYLAGDAGTSAVTTSASGISPSRSDLPIALSMTLPETPQNNFITVAGFISNSTRGFGPINLAIVIDTSASMGWQVDGAGVGDLNGNGLANERIDIFIASFNAFINSLKAAGLSEQVRIGLIPFSSTASIAAAGTPTSDTNGNGMSDILEAGSALQAQGGTVYSSGLGKAIDFFNAAPRGDNHVIFISDGEPDDYFKYSEVADILRNAEGNNATIRTIGFAGASNYYDLDSIDNGLSDTSSSNASSLVEMTAAMLASRVNVSDIHHMDVCKNGILAGTILPSQLMNTPFGLRYSTTITGLSATSSDDIEIRLVLNGSASPISTSQQTSAGTLVSNDSLDGGAGNDTLESGAGTNTLAGGIGNDVYRVENNNTVIRELAGQGTDSVESSITYSLNSTPLQYVENLTLLGSVNINATGNANVNRVEGNVGNNIIEGVGGNDTLMGGLGFDTVSYVNAASAVNVYLDQTSGTAQFNGKTDRLSSFEAVWGSAFADHLYGSSADETFRGNGGDDTIYGGDGFDTLDYSIATAGMTVSIDKYYYLDGKSIGTAICANGSQGTDYFGVASMEGVLGSAFNDNIFDAIGNNNRFSGGAGNDTLDGGAGNDTLIGGTGKNVLQGGAGIDVADYSDATSAISGSLINGRLAVGTTGVNADTISGVETLLLGKYADSVIGGAGNDSIFGAAGNDTLAGNTGNDTLNGGTGDDSLIGGAGNDIYYLDSVRDVVVEGSAGGIDEVHFTQASGSAVLSFSGVEYVIVSGGVSCSITGGGISETLDGSDGSDTINGGSGREADTLDGGAGSDWLSYANHVGGVVGEINNIGSGALDGDLTLNFENFIGSSFADNVRGDRFDNILDGGAGNDTLIGGFGKDTLIGGAGNDFLAGEDPIGGNSSSDTVSYAHLTGAVTINLNTGVAVTATEGTDTLSGIETIIGGSGNDVMTWAGNTGVSHYSSSFRLEGGGGNDTLTGGGDSDTLIGGAGNDVLDGGNAVRVFNFNYANYADYSSAAAAVVVDLNAGTASGGAGNDRLSHINAVVGSRYADQITGGATQGDYLVGGGGADTLDAGIDLLSNFFVFLDVSDSSLQTMDTLKNFKSVDSFAIDKIDLNAIDANPFDTDNNSAFLFIGLNAFTKTAGQLRYANSGGNTFVYGDVNGDGVADIGIKLIGTHTLSADNFML
ncbi:beta strand repeat-containing protein [Azohydromonas lata]|uniref:VWA domain-containing protein n=1 Tax=Azohydromonas lata TaxID=45677 RepID=A0ABU5IRB3_9BURK|nr:VWA domain-containing protein [Azohydromonas lata]MDZ5461437.1 VWA domain-containing protein [Azohydromonas lata]